MIWLSDILYVFLQLHNCKHLRQELAKELIKKSRSHWWVIESKTVGGLAITPFSTFSCGCYLGYKEKYKNSQVWSYRGKDYGHGNKGNALDNI